MIRGPYALHAPLRLVFDHARRLRDWRDLHRAQRAGAADPRVTPLRRSLALRAVAALAVSAVVAQCAPAQAESVVKLPAAVTDPAVKAKRSEEHTSELQSLMRISYAVFCLKKKN